MVHWSIFSPLSFDEFTEKAGSTKCPLFTPQYLKVNIIKFGFERKGEIVLMYPKANVLPSRRRHPGTFTLVAVCVLYSICSQWITDNSGQHHALTKQPQHKQRSWI